jgi:Tol biopolymer transport system component
VSLQPDTKLGSYEVVAQIGAGGMGEVYQAHDTKLGRDVAIKVLPEAFAHDADRLSRFQHEAKMLAALNHPNIATIFGLEHSDGVQYLVMELVSGETLAERVKRDGAVPVEEVLAIAKQIAEALEAAHEKGIIHRDLKPANVKVTPEGKVKVLDFGLAKAFEGDSTNEDMGNSPTLSRAATMQGVILGTAAYMSPEQARGKAVDKRTDIWAFGCVTYELLTGKQVFHGEDVTDILADVVRAEPDWTALPPNISPSIRVLLQRCLRKDRRQRTPDAATIRIEIEDAIAAPKDSGATQAAPAAKGWRRSAEVGLAIVLTAVIAGFAGWNLKPTPAPKPVTRFSIQLPPGQELPVYDNDPAVALSRDDTYLAYVARQGGTQQLYLRAMDSLEARPIPGTEGAIGPFFSPDGQWLSFFAGGKLKKVSVSGGGSITLGDAPQPRGASWGSEGTIAFAPVSNVVIQQISDAGGAPQPLTRFEKSETAHRWPELLPGNAMLFAGGAGGAWLAAQIIVQSSTGERRNLVQGATQPRYAPSGHLLYTQAGTLMAQPFDARWLEVTGKAVPVVEHVSQTTNGAAHYSISDTGSLVYVSGAIQSAQSKLVWVSRNGTEQPLAAPANVYRAPSLSPDGRRIAVPISGQETQTWLYDLSRDTLTRLTFGGNQNQNPVWTPDGKRIAFYSDKEGPLNIFWQLADGGSGLERLTTGEYRNIPSSWSPDGKLLAFIENNPTTGYDIWVLRLSDRKAQPFLRTQFNEGAPRFSPDGHWLAYNSDESGRSEVYIQPYPGSGGKWQISTEGGTEPAWNPSGRELFYRNGNKMMAVDIATQPSFAAGKPRMLFEGQYEPTPTSLTNYDVSPDGQRFLMLKPTVEAEAPPTQIHVVLNWFEELKQKVPTGKK